MTLLQNAPGLRLVGGSWVCCFKRHALRLLPKRLQDYLSFFFLIDIDSELAAKLESLLLLAEAGCLPASVSSLDVDVRPTRGRVSVTTQTLSPTELGD